MPPTKPAATKSGAAAPPVATIRAAPAAMLKAPIAKFLGEENIDVTGLTTPFKKLFTLSAVEIFPSSAA